MLHIAGLQVSYGGIMAVTGVDLDVDAGVVLLLGPNGAGKSSILKCVSGLVPAHTGRIEFDGADITAAPAHEIARMGIVHVPQGRRVFGALSVQDNLFLGAYGSASPDRDDRLHGVYETFPELRDRRNLAAGNLSGGEQQMLAIGRALMSGPRLLLMDEPSMGLAPAIVTKVMASITEIANRGVRILLVEQNVAASLPLADYVYVMRSGRLAREGRPSELPDLIALGEELLGK